MTFSRHISGLVPMAIICLILAALPALGASDPAEQLRKEIRSLEEKIHQAESSKLDAAKQLQDIELKLELRRQLIVQLEREANLSSKKINSLGTQIGSLEEEIATLAADLHDEESQLTDLRRQAGERAAFFYKKMAGARVAIIAGSKDFGDLFRRRKYIASVEEFEKKTLKELYDQKQVVAGTKSQRETLRDRLGVDQKVRLDELNQYRLLIRDRRAEEEATLKERAGKQSLIRRMEGDRTFLQALLDDRKKALDQIEKEIVRIEQAPRKSSVPDWSPDTPFKNLQGRLICPTPRLDVTQPFGQNRHPKLGTVTVNPGVDLRAEKGDPVRVVAAGQVTKITWLRGFGNTIIVSHGDGFYTVYARLDQISVGEGEVINAGQIIGDVGDASGQTGFHFEVWSKREKQDPLKWLKSK